MKHVHDRSEVMWTSDTDEMMVRRARRRTFPIGAVVYAQITQSSHRNPKGCIAIKRLGGVKGTRENDSHIPNWAPAHTGGSSTSIRRRKDKIGGRKNKTVEKEKEQNSRVTLVVRWGLTIAGGRVFVRVGHVVTWNVCMY